MNHLYHIGVSFVLQFASGGTLPIQSFKKQKAMHNANVTNETPIVILNVEQHKEVIREVMMEVFGGGVSTNLNNPACLSIIDENKYVYGYEGGMKLFHCSKPTFYRIMKSGKIAPAVKQIGKKIIIDHQLALELAGKKNGGRK